MIGHAQALDDLNELGLDDDARELFLRGNAEKVLKLQRDDAALPR
jgi:predicted TIM-barrel fold metal-dependent hydrolase